MVEPWLFYSVVSLGIILVGLAKGGFSGMGALTMPMIALVMNPVEAAAMLLPILIVQDVVGVWAFRRSWDRALIAVMLPGALFGVLLGWLFAAMVSVKMVLGAIGALSIIFGGNRLLAARGMGFAPKRRMPEWVGVFWGMVSGFTSHVAHAGGPPYQVWTLNRNLSREAYAGTAAIFFAALNWAKVPAYAALGQFTAANLSLTLLFLPLAIFATFAGVALVRRIDAARFFSIISVTMVLVGVKLVYDAFA